MVKSALITKEVEVLEKAILDWLEEKLPKFEHSGIVLDDEKEIPYGVQLTLSRGEQSIPLNVYWSKKKGLSVVYGGRKDNPLRDGIDHILHEHCESMLHDWTSWIGSDESGKGDFFGPLVVCAFNVDQETLGNLRGYPLDDSKKISDKNIHVIAEKLHHRFRHRIEIMALLPEKYNDLYENFRSQGKKLNQLLAWMHARVLVNSYQRFPTQGVVVDKFAAEYVLKSSLRDLRDIPLVNVERAEADPAVAAASILARHRFLMEMDRMSERFGMEFPKGGGAPVDVAAKAFVAKFGKGEMKKVAKIHFKNYSKLDIQTIQGVM